MLLIEASTTYKRDLKRANKQGQPLGKLKAVPTLLVTCQPLPASYRDHALVGNVLGYRECHISPDWLLIYKVEGDTLKLVSPYPSPAKVAKAANPLTNACSALTTP